LRQLELRLAALLCLASLPAAAVPFRPTPPVSAASAASPAPGEKAVYIVQLQEAPLAQAPGDIRTAAQPGGPRKLDLAAPDSRRYLVQLQGRQDEALAAISRTLGRGVEPRHRYSLAFNGFAVELTGAEAAALAGTPGVARVQRSGRLHIKSDAGPAWTGATGIWDGSGTGGLPGTQGEGIVIGVLDTGIALGHPSFADIGGDGYNHANPRGSGSYVGWCNPANPNYDSTLHCNDKLIGVWSWPDSGSNPRDDQGHGTHTASIAAGNHVTASLGGLTRPISGVAPHANLISYDVCDSGGYCQSSTVLAAVDQAVTDGVDVISLAFAGYEYSPWYDSVSQALLGARNAGIFVAAALDDGYSIGSPANAPWVLGVAASSHNRRFVTTLADMAGGTAPPPDLAGLGLTSAYGSAYLVYAGDYGDYYCSSPFPAGTFHGEIVVCRYDILYISEITAGQNVLAGGAGGLVLAQTYYAPPLEPVANVLPAIHLAPTEANALLSWLNPGSAGSLHRARITATTAQLDPAFADRLSPDSPQGPGYYSSNLMKPDVAAPGRSILAAHTDPGGYRLLDGSSMATAHAAGGAALLAALHPGWTPAEIQSALETTGAAVTRDDGSATNPLDVGGGRVALSAAARAGLVLNETTQHFQDANPGNGGDPRTLNLAGLENDQCNLSCGWTRTVRSTLAAAATWTASAEIPAGVGLTVSPASFTLPPGGTQVLQITITGSTSLSGLTSGRVILTPTGGQAPPTRLPLAVSWVPYYTLTVQKSGTGSGRVTSNPAGIDCGSDCSEPFEDSTYVTLTATASPGSVFVGWGSPCYDTSSTCSTSMYSNRTAVAYFNPPSPDKPLANQAPLKDSLNGPVSGGTWNYYYVDVGSGTGQLIVDVIDMDGAADLLVRQGAKPNFGQHDCFDYSYYGTPNLRCVITQPAAGRWWIGIVNEDEGTTIHYSIRASWGATDDRQLADHAPVNDFVSSSSPGGGWKYYFFDLPAGSSDLSVALSNLSADADLYLRQGAKPDRSNFDCSSSNASTLPEACTLSHPAAGRWWIGVNNFSAGTVTYTLLAQWNELIAPADFYSLTPCRLFDSRTAPQPLVSGTAQAIQATGACGIPAGARAVTANVTVVGPTGPGYVVLFPANEAQPLSSTVNFQSGQVRANNAVLKLDAAGALQALATVQSGGQTHLVVDVNGYYQ
jgi:subtilisin family serine protease